MTREEAKDLFRNDKDAYGKPRAIMHKIDQIFDAFEKPLPPAEGAVTLLTEEEYQKPENQNRDNPIIGYKYVKDSKQPTAEGAEEILKNRLGEQFGLLTPFGVKTHIAAMQDFAALHAQRLAEKMVEEKLKKEYERGIEDGKIIGKHGSVSYIE